MRKMLDYKTLSELFSYDKNTGYTSCYLKLNNNIYHLEMPANKHTAYHLPYIGDNGGMGVPKQVRKMMIDEDSITIQEVTPDDRKKLYKWIHDRKIFSIKNGYVPKGISKNIEAFI